MQWLQTEDDLDMSRWIIFITAYSKLIFAFYNWSVGSELELEGQNHKSYSVTLVGMVTL